MTAPRSRCATSADGTRIAYWPSGEGTPLVLVHGATSDHTRWEPLLHLLDPHFTVCAMDRRGRGGSGDGDAYAIGREFEDVAAVVDAVTQDAGEPVDLFGHSYGALCSLEAALLTSNVRNLALYEPPPPADAWPDPAELLDRLDRLIADGRRDEALEAFLREAVRSPDDEISLLRATDAWSVRVANVHTMLREVRAIGSYSFDPARFGSVSVPTLLLVGGDHPSDAAGSAEARAAMDALDAALPDCRIAVLEGQRHMALDTAPRLIVDTLLGFFGRTPE